MKRIIYGSLSVLTAVCTVLVAANPIAAVPTLAQQTVPGSAEPDLEIEVENGAGSTPLPAAPADRIVPAAPTGTEIEPDIEPAIEPAIEPDIEPDIEPPVKPGVESDAQMDEGRFEPSFPPGELTPVTPVPGAPDGDVTPVSPVEPLEPLEPLEENGEAGEFPSSEMSDERLTGEGFTPFQLSYLAIAGGLEEEGIPGGSLLISAFDAGEVSAEDIVEAGAATNRLGTAASDQADYTQGVDRFLEILERDARSNK